MIAISNASAPYRDSSIGGTPYQMDMEGIGSIPILCAMEDYPSW